MVDQIPSELIEMIGNPCYVQLSDGLVEAGAIRFFASVVKDPRPAYWRTDGMAVCPPAMLSAWNRPLKWQPVENKDALGLALHFMVKDRLNLPLAVVAASETEIAAPIVEGARVRSQQMLLEIGEPTVNRLGSGRYWTIRVEYRCERTDVLFGAEDIRFFGYREPNQK